jgi:hypothetical protein
MTPQDIVGLLAEPARLRVFSAVVLGAGTPSEIAARAGVPVKETAGALRRLEDGGLVEYADGGVRARGEHLKEAAREAARAGADRTPAVDHGSGDTDTESLLRTFLRDDGQGIRSLPRQFGRRRTVLRHLAGGSFAPGVTYTEREVDEILRGWCAEAEVDHVTVRRYLIDHCILTREDGGAYWLREQELREQQEPQAA